MLYKKCVLAADLIAARYVGHFYKQRDRLNIQRRHAAVNDPFDCVNLGWSKTHLVRVMIACRNHTSEYVLKFGFFADEAQQGFAGRPLLADAKNIFGRRIKANDEQGAVEQYDARAQAVENLLSVSVEAAATGTFGSAAAGYV